MKNAKRTRKTHVSSLPKVIGNLGTVLSRAYIQVEILIVSPRVLGIRPLSRTVVAKVVANELLVLMALVIGIPGALRKEIIFGANIQSLPAL